MLLSPNLSELTVPCPLAIRDRNSSWTFFSLKDPRREWCTTSWAGWWCIWMSGTNGVEACMWLAHLLPLVSPNWLHSLTSVWLSPHGNKTWPSIFPGFTSYTVCPWKKINFSSLKHKFSKKTTVFFKKNTSFLFPLKEEETYCHSVGQLPTLI